MQLLIMGPPGVGKGTQAVQLAARHTIPAISTGDIFRALRTADTELARQVRDIMDAGGYVTDAITNAIVADRINQLDCRRGFLLDGYPRTLGQVRALDTALGQNMKRIDAVIALHADPTELVARLLRRAETEARSDDNEATIRVRQQVCTEQTAPLITLYRDRGLLLDVDAIGSREEVAARISAALDKHRNQAFSASIHGR